MLHGESDREKSVITADIIQLCLWSLGKGGNIMVKKQDNYRTVASICCGVGMAGLFTAFCYSMGGLLCKWMVFEKAILSMGIGMLWVLIFGGLMVFALFKSGKRW